MHSGRADDAQLKKKGVVGERLCEFGMPSGV